MRLEYGCTQKRVSSKTHNPMEVEAASWGSDAQLLGRLERFEQNVDMLAETVLEVCFQSQTESFLCQHTEHPPMHRRIHTHTYYTRARTYTSTSQKKEFRFHPHTRSQPPIQLLCLALSPPCLFLAFLFSLSQFQPTPPSHQQPELTLL